MTRGGSLYIQYHRQRECHAVCVYIFTDGRMCPKFFLPLQNAFQSFSFPRRSVLSHAPSTDPRRRDPMGHVLEEAKKYCVIIVDITYTSLKCLHTYYNFIPYSKFRCFEITRIVNYVNVYEHIYYNNVM